MPHHLRDNGQDSANQTAQTTNIDRERTSHSNVAERPAASDIPKGDWNHGREPGRGTYPMNEELEDSNQAAQGVPGAHGKQQDDRFHTAAGDSVTEEFGRPHSQADQAQGDRQVTQPKD